MADQPEVKMKPTLGLTGPDHERHGADRAGRLPVAHLFHPGHGRAPPRPPCGSASWSPCCCAWRRPSAMRKWPNCIPAPGSSYYFAEQSFLNHDTAWRYARLSKFIVGWGSHLYYWIYPGVMVGVMGILVRLPGGHAVAQLHERVQSGAGVHDGWSRSCSLSRWPTSPTAA